MTNLLRMSPAVKRAKRNQPTDVLCKTCTFIIHVTLFFCLQANINAQFSKLQH